MTQSDKKALEEFDEVLPKMIRDLVWAVTDGGCKLEINKIISYQEEPVYEFEEIKSFILKTRQEARDEERQRIVEMLKNTREANAENNMLSIGERLAVDYILTDFITALTEQK